MNVLTTLAPVAVATDVVATRWAKADHCGVAAALTALTSGPPTAAGTTIQVRDGFRLTPTGWVAVGVVRESAAGRGSRMELAVSRWPGAVEVSVRPRRRRTSVTPAERRLRREVDLAHAAASVVADHLSRNAGGATKEQLTAA
jgi:hypothetical protein